MLDQQGVNKYLCPPSPSPALACLSSCTASPVSDTGFLAASATFRRIAAAKPADQTARRLECQADVEAGIRAYLGLGPSTEVMVTSSGTDGLLLAAVMLEPEGGGRPTTAILPSPAETGSGVPMAAACRTFDGPGAGRAVLRTTGETICVPLRDRAGAARETGAVIEAFGTASRNARGRAVLHLTHGTKTGLVAPAEVPNGVEVIVDACQLRLPPAAIRIYRGRGLPVVITGSRFLGGPAFSGAVLLPDGRFSATVRRRAELACAAPRRAATTADSMWSGLGPLLRWTAALADLDGAPRGEEEVDTMARRLEREAVAVVTALPGTRVIGGGHRCFGIVTFAVEAVAGQPGGWQSAGELRPLYRALHDQGVLVGQPVDVGPFGCLRLAIGLRDVVRGSVEASLRRLADA